MLNSPVAKFNTFGSDGLKFFWNIGLALLCKTKLFLFDLDPLIASYCAMDNDSVTLPYCKSNGKFNKSRSL